MFELIFFLILLIYSVDSEINSSADLNCNFAVDCLWRNGTNGVEDSGEFAPGTSLQMDDYHKVTALRSDRGGKSLKETPKSTYATFDIAFKTKLALPLLSKAFVVAQEIVVFNEIRFSDDPFIYSSAFGGRQTALLVSDVVSCQLGGASLKYWYWKTGTDAKLDICIRQPPGSRDPSTLKCYDGLASTHAQQWIYRSVEFPPISQPFELLFRATFTAPMDIIALDDINYDAILCDVRHGRGDEAREKRRVMLSVHERNQPLIVAGIDRDADVEALRLKRGSPPTIGQEQHLANMMTFLKGVAPVLPYVPTIVQTLQSLDPRASFSAPPLARSFASPTLDGVAPIVPKIGNPTLNSGSYKDDDRQLLNDVEKNAFGLRRLSTPEYSTIYPPKIRDIQKKRLPPEVASIVEEDGMNMNDLSPEEIKQLEAIHRKIFKQVPTSTQPSLVIYKKIPKPQVKLIDQRILSENASPQLQNVLNELPNNPKYAKIAPEMIDKFKEIASGLPPDVLNDMSQIQNIPNVDELVEGLDLELIRTPAGFQKIKNEFIARYMRRMMGLPVAMTRVASNTGGTVSGGGPFGGAAGGSYSNDATDSWPAISQAPPSALSDGGDGSPPIFLPLSPTGSRKSPGLAAPTIAENIDPPSPPRSPFDDTHFGYSRASAAKTIGQIAPPVETQTNRVTGPRLGPAFQPRCPPIDCTFDQNIFCDYVTAVSDSDLIGVTEGAKEWRLARNRVENTLTGIAKDLSGRGGYVWAGGVNDPSDIFVLSSRTPLMMPAASRLDFFVHIAGIAGRLRVCFDTLQQCPFEISHRQIGVQARQWKNYFVTVPEGSHTIHFVADGLRKNYVVGLDHIQLLSKYGMSAQPC
ncbi:unnamed protein product, partial [Mesorhabditis belari]|uniref:MAM domain-containing protein n=1 Tax=Mesorhabditis belari TaxID=2138241 RepID=A0AAF3J5L9_9BILA